MNSSKNVPIPKELLAEGGFLRQLTSALIGRCLETEMEEHLGYPKHGKRNEAKGNARNGSNNKTLKGAQGADHALPFHAIAKPALNQCSSPNTRPGWIGPGENPSLYALCSTTRDIQAQVYDLYGVEVSPTFVSNVTKRCLMRCVSGRTVL